MLVDVEGMRSATWYAAWAMAGSQAASADATAKVWSADAAKRVMASGLQVHGGIGFTWEHDLHLFIKQRYSSSFGDATHHRALLAVGLAECGAGRQRRHVIGRHDGQGARHHDHAARGDAPALGQAALPAPSAAALLRRNAGDPDLGVPARRPVRRPGVSPRGVLRGIVPVGHSCSADGCPAPLHVAVLLDNTPDYLFAFGGAALIGAAVVGLNHTRRDEHLLRDVVHTHCGLVITEPRHEALLAPPVTCRPSCRRRAGRGGSVVDARHIARGRRTWARPTPAWSPTRLPGR